MLSRRLVEISLHDVSICIRVFVQVLLVFPRDDHQVEVLDSVARKLGWSVSIAKNSENATELFLNRCHDLVIIDRRGQRATEGDAICR